MTGRPKGKKTGEGAGCKHGGQCDSCPYEDCVATAIECTNFYRDEERATRARFSLKAIRKEPTKAEIQRDKHNAISRAYHAKYRERWLTGGKYRNKENALPDS